MSENVPHSLMNIGDLAKPIDSLINRVSDFIGGAFAPHQIKRIAKANAEAAIIDAQNETYISEIKVRAAHRIEAEQVRHQRSMEEIVQKSTPLLEDKSRPEDVDNDWLEAFFSHARLVSNEEMQLIWAKILAGEVNKPGAFSKRTLDLVSKLSHSEAELFTKLCGYVFDISGYGHQPLIFSVTDDVYKGNGLGFKEVQLLESTGLIESHTSGVGLVIHGVHGWLTGQYHERILKVVIKDVQERFPLGKIDFTNSGRELFLLSGCKPVDGFFEYIQEVWKNWIVTE